MDLVKLSANLNCFFEQSIKKYANEALASELLSHLSGKEAFHQPSHIAKIKETASLLSDMEKNYFELSEMLKDSGTEEIARELKRYEFKFAEILSVL